MFRWAVGCSLIVYCIGFNNLQNAARDLETCNDPNPQTTSNEEAVTEDAESDSVTVNAPVGSITGTKESLPSGGFMLKFLGIPYAESTAGAMRFMPPKPKGHLGKLNAFEFGSQCLQIVTSKPNEIVGSEDCLVLNVFTKLSSAQSSAKPVMLYIHGGRFVWGSADGYDPAPLVEEDVIVVTINYRIGGLGFLTLGNNIISGNMGLRDQIEAINWTKHNIAAFGGDPLKITIFGNSAGSLSASALQLSPKIEGLVSGAIMQSGNMLRRKDNPKLLHEERKGQNLADLFNCTSEGYDERTLKCLQKVNSRDFVLKTKIPHYTTDTEEEGFDRSSWSPVVDAYSADPVMPVEPLEALKTGQFNKFPVITGTVVNDAVLFSNELELLWNLTAPTLLRIAASANKSESTKEEFEQADKLLNYYTGGQLNILESPATMRGFYNMLTDAFFLSPDQKLAELVSLHAPVFNYRFSYVSNSGNRSYLTLYLTKSGIPEEQHDLFFQLKPIHGDELYYLFNLHNLNGQKDAKEEEISQTLIKYWTNFAKYGSPNPLFENNMTDWKPYTEEKLYVEFKAEPVMKTKVEEERMDLWQDLVWNRRENAIQ